MSDLISREWVLNKIWEREKEPNYQHESEDWSVGLIMAENIVSYASTIEAEPIKHGRWIYDDEAYPGGNPYGHYNCDQCGESVPHKTIYCPNCGARMFDKDTDVPDKNVGKMDEVEE